MLQHAIPFSDSVFLNYQPRYLSGWIYVKFITELFENGFLSPTAERHIAEGETLRMASFNPHTLKVSNNHINMFVLRRRMAFH